MGRHIEKMHIDDDRLNVLTKIVNKKSKGSKGPVVLTESDHNTITAELKLQWNTNNVVKSIEIYKYNDMESLKAFKEHTTNTKELSSIFDTDKDLNIQTKKLLKRLKGFIVESFDKIKIRDQPNKELDRLYNKRRILRTQKGNNAKLELKTVEKELADKYGEHMYKHIKEDRQ